MELLAREYAKIIKRKPEQVLNWISSGAIPAECVRRAGRRTFVDAEAATIELTERGLLSASGSGGDGESGQSGEEWETRSLDEWEQKEKYFKAIEASHRAANAELDLAIKQGKFLPASEVQSEVDKMIVATKAKLLSVPSQLSQRIEVSKVVRDLVDSLIREALEELTKDLAADEEAG